MKKIKQHMYIHKIHLYIYIYICCFNRAASQPATNPLEIQNMGSRSHPGHGSRSRGTNSPDKCTHNLSLLESDPLMTFIF